MCKQGTSIKSTYFISQRIKAQYATSVQQPLKDVQDHGQPLLLYSTSAASLIGYWHMNKNRVLLVSSSHFTFLHHTNRSIRFFIVEKRLYV